MRKAFQISPSSYLYSLIYQSIFNPEIERLYKHLNELSSMNVAKGANTKVMSFDGNIIAPDRTITLGVRAAPVHPDLLDQVREVHNELKSFAHKRTYVKNCCSFLVSQDADYQEFRDSLSDMIVSYIPELKNHERTREEMFWIINDEAKVRQWTKAKEHIEYYIGNLLVYG